MIAKKLTIYDIKEMSKEKSPYFFSPNEMRFFNQTMEGFSVVRQSDGRTKISQPMRNHEGRIMGMTIRYFNPLTNELEME